MNANCYYSKNAPFDTGLPPVGQIRLPLSRLRNDFLPLSPSSRLLLLLQSCASERVVLPLFDTHSDTSSAYANPNAPRPCFAGPSGQLRDALLTLGNNEDRASTVDSVLSAPAERDVPTRPRGQPRNHCFQFIQIHEASGKADSAAGSRLRSHLMRKYHEDRRRNQKARPKVRKGCNRKGCSHVEVLLVSEHPPSWTKLPENTQISHSFSSAVASENSFHSTDLSTQLFPLSDRGLEIDFSPDGRLVCSQCGNLMLLYSPNDGRVELRSFRETPRSSLLSSSHDPFDSLAISISHRMHAMVHHCKTSSGRIQIAITNIASRYIPPWSENQSCNLS
jgi:hypothetical protein